MVVLFVTATLRSAVIWSNTSCDACPKVQTPLFSVLRVSAVL